MTNLTLAVQTIKDTISAEDIGRAIGLEIRHGRCKCPIHGGHDFNCVLYKGNRGFYCHVCKSGGDVIKFVQQYYGTSFKDSVSWINDTFHMGMDLNSTMTQEQRRQAENAQRTRKNAIEFQQWKKDMLFNMVLTADQILEKLEEQRDANIPKTKDEPWNTRFCEAIRTIPVARRFAEKCMADCIDVK